MGGVKNAMIEYESFDWEETSLTFACPECEEESDGIAELPVVERNYIFPIDTDIEIECTFCQKRFDAQISMNSDVSKITIYEYPKTEVEFDPVYSESIEQDYWESDYLFERPVSAYNIFKISHSDVVNFTKEYGDNDGYNAMNRMIFAQSFSVFEAYLCDKLLSIVLENEENRKIFIEKHEQIKKVTFSISDMISKGNLSADEIIEKTIIQTIQKTLFHNLSKTIKLFRMYKMNIFATQEDKGLLFKAVEYRHHCVHRNGCDKDGNKLDVFTKDYNFKVAAAMLATVEKIEDYM